jgi:hypothetical protein
VGSPDTVRLLHGPYTPPALKPGDRSHCHLRDATVVITSWSDALTPWPRCRALGNRGGLGLLVDDGRQRKSPVTETFQWPALAGGRPSGQVGAGEQALFEPGSRPGPASRARPAFVA